MAVLKTACAPSALAALKTALVALPRTAYAIFLILTSMSLAPARSAVSREGSVVP